MVAYRAGEPLQARKFLADVMRVAAALPERRHVLNVCSDRYRFTVAFAASVEKSVIPQIPVNRLGEPEEIARAVIFLAADDAGFITGSTLTVNGGQYHA